jgi:hypothetical protein
MDYPTRPRHRTKRAPDGSVGGYLFRLRTAEYLRPYGVAMAVRILATDRADRSECLCRPDPKRECLH